MLPSMPGLTPVKMDCRSPINSQLLPQLNITPRAEITTITESTEIVVTKKTAWPNKIIEKTKVQELKPSKTGEENIISETKVSNENDEKEVPRTDQKIEIDMVVKPKEEETKGDEVKGGAEIVNLIKPPPAKSRPQKSALEKKKAKLQKEYENTVALMAPENPKVLEEKAQNFAQAYFNKVKERLTPENPEDYNLFLATLSDHDESSNSVTDLYSKVTAILSPKHPDLCDELITFLTPSQAKQIEKLIPFNLQTRMANFLRKLEIQYSKQPAQIRKIYNTLTDFVKEEATPTMDAIKAAIFPLLKGNTILIDYFTQIFPNEKPPESLMTVWEELEFEPTCKNPEKRVGLVNEEECFEKIIVPDVVDQYGNSTCICDCHNSIKEEFATRNKHCIPCGTKFLQGKVFIQTGKGPRSASVSFPGSSLEEQSKRLSIQQPIIQCKRRFNGLSPSKNPLNTPTKSALHTEDPDNESKPAKIMRTQKSPKTTAKRRLSTTKSKKETPKTPTQIIKIPEIKKDDDPPVAKRRIKPVTLPLDDSFKKVLSTSKLIKFEPNQEDWDDCNVSVESIELRLSPDRSFGSCEESSQDVSDANEQAEVESENDSIIETESVNDSESSDQESNDGECSSYTVSWTRDDDKILLKTYQQECDSENTFELIHKLLPNRTVKQIKERFETLINLLVQIKKQD